MKRFLALAFAAWIPAASSCSPRGTDASPTEPGAAAPVQSDESPETAVRAYDCGGDLYVVAEFRPATQDVWLFLPGKSGRLPRARSASGAKYGDGETTFWTKGDEALLDTGDGTRRTCIENRRRSIIESSKLRGNDFWATGNEPGWTLEIGPETVVFVTDYGQSRYEMPTPDPVSDPSTPATTWSGAVDGHEIVVTIRPERCADTMSDETYESRVEVRVDDRVYTGCGQPLH